MPASAKSAMVLSRISCELRSKDSYTRYPILAEGSSGSFKTDAWRTGSYICTEAVAVPDSYALSSYPPFPSSSKRRKENLYDPDGPRYSVVM